MLTVNINLGFRFGDNSANIVNQSNIFPVQQGEIDVVKSIRIGGFDKFYGETRINASELIAQNVCTQTVNSEFVNIGKGGLPPNPDEVLTEGSVEVGLVEPVSRGAEVQGNKGAGIVGAQGLRPIVEAQSLRPAKEVGAGRINSGGFLQRQPLANTIRPTRKPPAQGWIWHEDGTVELVAYNPQQVGEPRTWNNPGGCKF